MNKPKIISIMPVWDEQNMIGLSIASKKDIVYQYQKVCYIIVCH